MENVLRTLIWDEQVSLTLVDATEIVNEAIRLHGLSRPAALVLGKTLSVMTFMSACLKEETGEVSVSLKGNGRGRKAFRIGELRTADTRLYRLPAGCDGRWR